LIDNAVKKFGAQRIWVYDPTNSSVDSGGNCQRFWHDLLDASNLLNPSLSSFILQDAGVLTGDTAKIGQALTNLAARFHILQNGTGTQFLNTKNRPPRVLPSFEEAAAHRLQPPGQM